MKIVFTMPSFPLLSETFILNQIVGLIERGHEVYILSIHKPKIKVIKHPEIEKYKLLDNVFYFSDIPTSRRHRYLNCVAFGIKCFFNLKSLYFFLKAFKNGFAAIDDILLYKLFNGMIDFNIIHCQYGSTGKYGIGLKTINKDSKLVTTFHGFDIRMGIKKGGQIYRHLFEQGDCFFAISDHNLNHLLEFGLDKDKIIKHPVGIDTFGFSPNEKTFPSHENQQVIVTTVARLVEEKALHIAIKAIGKTMLDQPDVNIIYNIIGDGPLKVELIKLVNDMKIQNVVRFLGPLDQSGVISVLQQSNLFLFTSIAEVLPVSLMEAQSIGLPVVTTDVGDAKTIVIDGKTGFVVKQNDIDALSEKLIHLIKSPELRSSMGSAGRSHIVANFDINKLNDKLVDIYADILGHNNKRIKREYEKK